MQRINCLKIQSFLIQIDFQKRRMSFVISKYTELLPFYSLNYYLLGAHCTILGTRDTALNKTDRNLYLCGDLSGGDSRERGHNQISTTYSLLEYDMH